MAWHGHQVKIARKKNFDFVRQFSYMGCKMGVSHGKEIVFKGQGNAKTCERNAQTY